MVPPLHWLPRCQGQGSVPDGVGLSQPAATSIVGAYGGLVYLSSILGTWVPDRLLGAERTLTSAAVVIMCGHLALALFPWEWPWGWSSTC